MPVALELIAECDEGLYISATTNNLDYDVERNSPLYLRVTTSRPSYECLALLGWRRTKSAK